jgi:uncharacterized membrane protein YdbT with pleckstrin-like domain
MTLITMNISSLVIRQSPAILVYRIAWLTMALYVLFAMAYPIVINIDRNIGEMLDNHLIRSLITIVVESLLIVGLFIHWSMTTFEIRQHEIVFRSGILKRRMEIHSLKNIQTVYASQPLLGRTFGYGNIRLYNPMSKEELLLEQVPDPETLAGFLRDVLNESGQETILRTSSKS